MVDIDEAGGCWDGYDTPEGVVQKGQLLQGISAENVRKIISRAKRR